VTAAGAPQAVAVSLDGAELYVANEGGTVEVVTIATGATAATISLGCGGYGLVRTPDGAQLYVSCSQSGLVKIVDPGTRTVVGTLTTSGIPRRVATSRDGRAIAVANEGGWVDFIQ
jgi:YVTN family beta-propeller protein